MNECNFKSKKSSFMDGIVQLLAFLLIVYIGFQVAPNVKKVMGLSFVNTNDNVFYEIVYKGKTLSMINKECVLVFFDGKEYPNNNNFKCVVQISKDYEHIKYTSESNQIIWENGEEKLNILSNTLNEMINDAKDLIDTNHMVNDDAFKNDKIPNK